MKRIISFILVSILLMVQLSPNMPLVFAQENSGAGEVTYTVDRVYNQDSNTVSITVKAQPAFSTITVDSISTPEDELALGCEATYVAKDNGSYQFLITYTVQTENNESITSGSAIAIEPEAGRVIKTVDINVEVTDIIEEVKVLTTDGVVIDAEHFPDVKFREYVRQYDVTLDGILDQSELNSVTQMGTFLYNGVKADNLKGIEYFTELTKLYCGSMELQNLDISNNQKLEVLEILECKFKTLDLTNNTALKVLKIHNSMDMGKLTTLDVTKNTELITLVVPNNKLSDLDLSQNKNLLELDVDRNQMKKLDISQCLSLETLRCNTNRLKILDIGVNNKLQILEVAGNQLTAVDLVNNKVLHTLSLYSNQLTQLDLSENKELKKIDISSNQLTQLDTSNQNKLEELRCNFNQLTTMDISKNTLLNRLDLGRQKVYRNQIWAQKGDNYEFDMKKLVGEKNLGNILEVSDEEGFIAYDSGSGIITASKEFNFIYEYDPKLNASLTVGDDNMDISVDYSRWYSIDAFADENGSITPSGGIRLKEGSNQEYMFTPNEGYIIDQLIIDNNEVTLEPSKSSYTFQDIRENHNIEVTFKPINGSDIIPSQEEYYIGAVAKQYGSINPSGVTRLKPGTNLSYTITPDDGYEIDRLLIDGELIEPVEVYEFKNVTQNHRIDVSFKKMKASEAVYNINAIAGANGKIDPLGVKKVKAGLEQKYTITPNEEYEIETLLIDGISVKKADVYTFWDVQAHHRIEVTFKHAGTASQDDRKINTINFPDADFRTYVRQFDINDNSILENAEIEAVRTINTESIKKGNDDMLSLDGIEYFTKLTSLDCSNQKLVSLDISKNTELIELNCSMAGIKKINLKNNTKLEKLNCSGGSLDSIDLTNNSALKELITPNYLKYLDLSNNISLVKLDCFQLDMESLNLENNNQLKEVVIKGGFLKKLVLGNNINLQELTITENNNFTNLDISQNTGLKKLELLNIGITSLDVSKNLELEALICNSYGIDALTNLILGKNTELRVLNCSNNKNLKPFDLSGCTALETLECMNNNSLDTLDISGNLALISLVCEESPIKVLNLNNNKLLKNINCTSTKIQKLNLQNNEDLEEIICFNTVIRSLDVTQNKKLKNLYFSYNQITEIDLKQNTELELLWCQGNDLGTLDVRNNPNLKMLACSGNKLTRVDVRKNTKLELLNCSDNQIEQLDVKNNLNLLSFVCSNNKITKLDISKNTLLVELDASNQKVSKDKIWIKEGNNYQFDLASIVGKENLQYIVAVKNNMDEQMIFNKESGIITSSEECEFYYEYDLKAIYTLFGFEIMDVSVRLPGAYSINAVADTNGSITPKGESRIKEGLDQTYKIIPNSGYEIDQLLIDKKNITPVISYTFQNIDADHSIEVTFKPSDGGTVTPPGGGDNGGGTVTPPGGGDNGGGIVTPPSGGDNGGETVTPPGGGDNGGETVTPPGGGNNGGGTITPPGGGNNGGGTTTRPTVQGDDVNNETNTVITRPTIKKAANRENQENFYTTRPRSLNESSGLNGIDIKESNINNGEQNVTTPNFGAADGKICILHYIILLIALVLTLFMLIRRKNEQEKENELKELKAVNGNVENR